MQIQDIKNRFGIIGSSGSLDRALEIAQQVASTNLSVLITGESGVGKEVFSKIIHQLSARKHGPFIAVNCGAIPEGTIDSELFGHEKGAFTGASESRKGYFEGVNGGTIFLDEVADLPHQTQVRLLRVLETGEFIRVGSSKVQKTDVRVVAATNINMQDAIRKGKFREDLFYRLNTVPIRIPSLRERAEDIPLLFRKFAADFAETYKMPSIRLMPEAIEQIKAYAWPGNVRQLKNVAEQISVLEHDREIALPTLISYLPQIEASGPAMPILASGSESNASGGVFSDREVLYSILVEMRKELNDLKGVVYAILQQHPELASQLAEVGVRSGAQAADWNGQKTLPQAAESWENAFPEQDVALIPKERALANSAGSHSVEESLSLQEQEMELISKALKKHRGKRKNAARELGISERTLYRKIKEFGIKY
ncbi:MAG: sigma-54 interaction domain-containing protein [Flavobacteriales bacterium]|jgi:DNA-binding NtrC family response regulator